MNFINTVQSYKKEILFFILIPLLFNLLSFSLYFSGQETLQSIIAPKVAGVLPMSWREFGLVELTQNICLLVIVVIFLRAVIRRSAGVEKAFFLTGVLVMLFLLLEEIDYGLHFYHFFSDSPPETARLNWHNQHTFSDQENGKYLRRISDIATIIWFVLVPLSAVKIKYSHIRALIPSLWFIPALIVSALCSSLAHYLEDSGMGVINGQAGLLEGNISEFRETTSYYIYLLYAVQLNKVSLFGSHKENRHETEDQST